jgi:Niemann-Pick C1 protein
MNTIAAELATLNDTVLAPIYSWTTSYQNFITTNGAWSEVCNSKYAALLDFDAQMRLFVQVPIESDCCQKYGVCGEQFSQDIIFDDFGTVRATRFRFQHQTMKSQEDYIRGMLETRRACDEFGAKLYPNTDQEMNLNIEYGAEPTLFEQIGSALGLMAE